MKNAFLGDLTRAQFLRRHWQKQPLFAAGALGAYAHTIERAQLFELAARHDVESRVVLHARGRWEVRHGPFTRAALRALPRSGWTLLVQGVDQRLRQAARLLGAFAFIPYARLDDVMVSYAVRGGGVGPHFDSYDVFLVQAQGERRWQVSAQRDLELVPDAPLKLLRRFTAEHEWTAAPGDVLYLPPQYAHDGVAVDECITCSVGFRAPHAQELASRFLEFLQDRLDLDGLYADPDLVPTRSPAHLPASMLDYAQRAVDRVRWSRRELVEFLGSYLTEPKAHVVFERPEPRLARAEFARRMERHGVRLAGATRMLLHGKRVFMNGETVEASAPALHAFARLADLRELAPPVPADARLREQLHEWYAAGYVEIRA